MKKKVKIVKGLLAGTLSFTSFSAAAYATVKDVSAVEKEKSYTQYVDPFVSTEVDYGQLFPGSVVPNALVKLSPDTYPHDTLDHAGYDYKKTQIQGFSHTRIEGVGGQGAGGDVLITPTYVQYTARPNSKTRAMSYEKSTEEAKPGYYKAELTPNVGKDDSAKADSSMGKIKAEMTSDQRTGYHRYTFPKAGNVNIMADLNYTYHGTDVRNATLDIIEENNQTTTLGGRFSGKNVGGSGKYTMYFYMETNKATNNVKTWNGKKLTDKKSQTGNDLGAILNFDVEDNETIDVKVSISPISVAQAKIDMHNEIDDWNFDAVYQKAYRAWNDVLSKIKIETSKTSDPTGELKQLFYTHLYHMFMTPMNATSTTGTFRGTDGKIHNANDYTHYDSWTLWDDYRKYPMIGLVMPDVYKDMVKSIADALDYGIVTWSHDKQPVPNVRTEHAVALLADGIAKGYTDIDNLERAYEEAKKIANKAITSDVEKLGYFANRVDRTAEYAYDDWALSIIAEALGKKDEAQYYLKRSFNYKNMFRANAVQSPFSDKKLGLLWNKDAQGNWRTDQDPSSYNTGLYQGNMWQYSLYDSNDINGLMELMGGKESLLESLQYLFGEHDPDNGKAMQHNAANEVELHAPYLFNFAGKPAKAQYWIRQIYTGETWNQNYASGATKEKMYKLSPKGYLNTMDDDAGTMAMMFVSAAMGIFPMTPGDPTFQIGSPFFEKVSLDVGGGKTFTIEANNVSPDNMYIQSAKLNGVNFNRTWLDYSEITRGGTLSLEMSDNADTTWAQDGVAAISSSDTAPTSYYDNDPLEYSNATFEESVINDGSIDQSIELKVHGTEFVGDVHEDLTLTNKIVISNVPKGLIAHAVKKTADTLEINFTGKAEKHNLTDSISNLKVEVNEAATKDKITSIRSVKDNLRIMFNDDTLNYSSTKLKEASTDNGTIVETSTITLTGDAQFKGAHGEDFVKTNKVSFTNVPAGLTPVVKKIDEKTVVLSFTGNAKKHDYDVDLALEFNDNAFDGTKANVIKGSALSGMSPFVLDFYRDERTTLKNMIEEAKKLNQRDYTKASYQSLLDCIEEYKGLLDQDKPSEKDIENAVAEINQKLEELKVLVLKKGTMRLEAGKSDSWSGNGLKNEGDYDLGGTYDGAWIAYDSLDFDIYDIKTFDVRYSSASSRVPNDCTMEVRLDAVDGKLIATVPLKNTASGWGTFDISTVDIDSSLLKGQHDVYFVMHGTTDDAHPYTGNIDYMQFNEENVVKELAVHKFEAEAKDDWSGGTLKIEGTDQKNLGGTYNDAWLKYSQYDFDQFNEGEIAIRYAANTNCGDNARVEVYLDQMEGTPISIIDVPITGSWSRYVEVSKTLSNDITGKHDIYFKLKVDSARSNYVANIDWFALKEKTLELKKNKLEAEERDDWSGGNLKIEGDVQKNIGGTYNNAWLKYNQIDFSNLRLGEIAIRYAANTNCGDNAKVEFYLDDMEGIPLSTIEVPITGSWNNYVEVSKELTKKVTGKHDLYVKLKVDPARSHYVANIDWFELRETNTVDKTKLNDLYKKSVVILDNRDMYERISFERVKSYLNEVEDILDNKSVTQSEIDYVMNKLQKSLDLLEYQIISDLDELVTELEKVSGDYTKTSWDTLQSAISVAKNIKKGSDYAVYKTAYDKLINANTQLTLLNRDILKATILRMETVNVDLYKETHKADFVNTLKNAQTLINEKLIEQTDLDKMTEQLNAAYSALELKVIYTELGNLIDSTNQLKEAHYTKESWEKLQTILEQARKVYNNSEASQQEVNDAVDKLEDAIKQLVKVPNVNVDPKPDDKPNIPNMGDKPHNGNINDMNNPQTGDQINIIYFIGLMGLSLLSTLLICKRKKIEK